MVEFWKMEVPMTVDLLVLFLMVLCLLPAEWNHPLAGSIRPDYLSPESGRSLRGLLSMGVLFHHMGQQKMGFVLLPLFSKIGYLLVSVFFFLSGYGLMCQHMAKERYRRSFFLRRLPTILLPYALATVLYALLYAVLGEPWSLRQILRGLVNGSPMVTASWYILCILLFYCVFGCLMWLCGRQFPRMLLGCGIFLAGYTLICRKLGYGSWWYNTAPVLLLGMTWAVYKRQIDDFLRRHFPAVFGGIAGLFLVVYGGKILLNPYLGDSFLPIGLTWLVAALFVCCVVLVLTQVRFSSPLLRRLGDISLEIYLYQFFFLQLLRSPVIFPKNDLVYVTMVLLCTLVTASLLHRLTQRILRR